MRYSILILLVIFFACNEVTAEKAEDTGEKDRAIKIMTFNMWHGGDAGKQPLNKTIETIEKSGAGIVGAQETYGTASPRPDNSVAIAQRLGWEQVDQGGYHAILTKYEVLETSSSKRAFKIKTGDNQFVWFFNCHLGYIPYQPYQLAGIKYGEYPFISSEQEAIEWANKARMAEVNEIIVEVKEKLKEGYPVVVTGDFNEPSHQDWTQRAADAGICKIKVEWPSTKAFTDLGMKDAFRTFHPDEVAFPGKTWTSIDSPGEVHDRIDFIFFSGTNLKLTNVEVIGEKAENANIVIPNYPSDHRSVVATFEWIK